MDGKGQSALMDAVLFLVIASVVSGAVLAIAAGSEAPDEARARAEAQAYAEDVRVALLRTTLPEAQYFNRSGDLIDLGAGVPVERFLLDEGALLSAGLPAANFAATNNRIRGIASDLVRPPFAVSLELAYSGGTAGSIWLGDETPEDRFTSSWNYEAGGAQVTVAVHLWYG